MSESRFCRLCRILTDLPKDVTAYADRLYDLMPETDRSGEEQMKERLSVCAACEKQSSGTCLACGCLCAVRVMGKDQSCPYKKW